MKLRLFYTLTLLALFMFVRAQERSLSYFEPLMQLSDDSLMAIGNHYNYNESKPDSALVCYTIVANRYDSNASIAAKQKTVRACLGKWYVYFFYYFDHSKSFESISRAEEICHELGNDGQLLMPRIYLNYGCMYETLAEQSREDSLNTKAIHYFREAFRTAASTGDYSVLSMAFGNMIFVAHSLGSIDEIAEEHRQYVEIRDSVFKERTYDYSDDLFEGLTLIHRGQWQEALAVFEHQKANSKTDASYARYQILTQNNIALSYATGKQYAKAVSALQESERMAMREDMKDAKLEIYRMFMDYAQKAGNETLTNEYRNKYFALKDSLLNYHQLASVSQLQFLNDMRQMDRRMAEIVHQRQVERMVTFIVIGLALLTLIFLAIIWRKNRVLKAANRQLYEKSVAMLQSEKPVTTKTPATSTLADEALAQRIKQTVETSDEIFSPDFSVERLSQLVDSKSRTVSRIINDVYDCNSSQFINEYRIREACRRINDSEHYGKQSFEAIANGVGFRSRSTFVIAFKRFTGLTPSEYQRIAHEKGRDTAS